MKLKPGDYVEHFTGIKGMILTDGENRYDFIYKNDTGVICGRWNIQLCEIKRKLLKT